MNLSLNTYENPIPIRPQTQWPEDFWPMLFDQMPWPMVIFDQEGRILLANDEAVKRLDLTGLEDFILPDTLRPLKAGAMDLELRGSRTRTLTMPSPADGNPIRFQLRHLPYGDGLILATGQNLGNEKLGESLDETTAVATAMRRQVTGPLAGIELYASIVGRELEEAGDSALADIMEQIRFGVREVNEYLTNFNSMAQPLSLSLESCKLMDVVDEALGAMNDVFKERAIGVLVTQKDLTVEMDRGLMVQLMLNLLLNAVEAMPDGGRIFIEFGLDKPGLVEIILTDTGPGVPLDQMKRVFSPFHTSKDQPLGLGLPVSLRIAEAHQGGLIVGSDLNMGARAVLSLPYLPESIAPASGSLN
jgi:signal transduction histidine kinase